MGKGAQDFASKGGDYSWQLKGKTTNLEKMGRKSKYEEPHWQLERQH
jgi:hypothetical protein